MVFPYNNRCEKTKIVLTYRERSLFGDGYFAFIPGVGGECLWSGLLVPKSKILTKTIIFLSKKLEGLDAYIVILSKKFEGLDAYNVTRLNMSCYCISQCKIHLTHIAFTLGELYIMLQ